LTGWHRFFFAVHFAAMKITEIPLSEIKPYPNNPRKNKKGIAAVKRSIQEFGFTVAP
jgi:ParB-like chromosome segregation protein Spo0J